MTKLEAVTLYLIDNKHEGELNRTRKGILLYTDNKKSELYCPDF